MRTEQEIKDKITEISEIGESGDESICPNYDVPWREVCHYGELLLKWVLGEVETAHYCSIHRKTYDASHGENGCPECLLRV